MFSVVHAKILIHECRTQIGHKHRTNAFEQCNSKRWLLVICTVFSLANSVHSPQKANDTNISIALRTIFRLKKLSSYSENSKHRVSMWHHSCDVISVTFKFLHHNHDITRFAENHEKCQQILDSLKRTERSHRCLADTNNAPTKFLALCLL